MFPDVSLKYVHMNLAKETNASTYRHLQPRNWAADGVVHDLRFPAPGGLKSEMLSGGVQALQGRGCLVDSCYNFIESCLDIVFDSATDFH
jgi:hypothetical protein